MQKDSAADIELNLKKKARRRLVGAIAMVVLMVILLPILLKDRTAAVSQDDVKISIQHEEVLVPETPAPTQPTDFDSNVVPAEKVPALPETKQSEAGTPTPVVTAKPEVVQEDPEAAAPVKPAKQTEAAKSSVAPKASAVLKADAASKESAATKNSATIKEDAAKDKFFVQIGVFSEMSNVKQLQSKLSSLGYQSKTEKISTPKGEKIRLRSQVFDSRNEAAIALQNIKEAGLTGMVVSQ